MLQEMWTDPAVGACSHQARPEAEPGLVPPGMVPAGCTSNGHPVFRCGRLCHARGCCLQLLLSFVLLRALVISGAASPPLQVPLTDCCGRAHLGWPERDEELGGP